MAYSDFLRPGEQLADLQFAGLHLIQNQDALKFGTDAVLLSSFIQLRPKERLADLGTGTGILPILLSGRVWADMTGIEIQPAAAELAARNAGMNGLDNIKILQADLKDAPAILGHGSMDVVCANPPYDKPDAGAMKGSEALRISRYEVACTLEDVVKSAAALLHTGGRFYLIYRAYRLAELMYCLKTHKLEPKELRIVCKHIGAEPRYVLVKAQKEAAAGMRIPPPLILYGADGAYTPELRQIYHMDTEE